MRSYNLADPKEFHQALAARSARRRSMLSNGRQQQQQPSSAEINPDSAAALRNRRNTIAAATPPPDRRQHSVAAPRSKASTPRPKTTPNKRRQSLPASSSSARLTRSATKRLREKENKKEEVLDDDDDAADSDAATATPSRATTTRRRSSTPSSTAHSTSNKKQGVDMQLDAVDEEEEESFESPLKKQRTNKVKKAPPAAAPTQQTVKIAAIPSGATAPKPTGTGHYFPAATLPSAPQGNIGAAIGIPSKPPALPAIPAFNSSVVQSSSTRRLSQGSNVPVDVAPPGVAGPRPSSAVKGARASGGVSSTGQVRPPAPTVVSGPPPPVAAPHFPNISTSTAGVVVPPTAGTQPGNTIPRFRHVPSVSTIGPPSGSVAALQLQNVRASGMHSASVGVPSIPVARSHHGVAAVPANPAAEMLQSIGEEQEMQLQPMVSYEEDQAEKHHLEGSDDAIWNNKGGNFLGWSMAMGAILCVFFGVLFLSSPEGLETVRTGVTGLLVQTNMHAPTSTIPNIVTTTVSNSINGGATDKSVDEEVTATTNSATNEDAAHTYDVIDDWEKSDDPADDAAEKTARHSGSHPSTLEVSIDGVPMYDANEIKKLSAKELGQIKGMVGMLNKWSQLHACASSTLAGHPYFVATIQGNPAFRFSDVATNLNMANDLSLLKASNRNDFFVAFQGNEPLVGLSGNSPTCPDASS